MTTTPDLPPAHVDTEQHKRCLKSNQAARTVRAMFPRGTRVEATKIFSEPGNGRLGTVVNHVPSMTADGGRLSVLWDDPNPFGGGVWISPAVWAGGLLVIDPATGKGTVRAGLDEHVRNLRRARNAKA